MLTEAVYTIGTYVTAKYSLFKKGSGGKKGYNLVLQPVGGAPLWILISADYSDYNDICLPYRGLNTRLQRRHQCAVRLPRGSLAPKPILTLSLHQSL